MIALRFKYGIVFPAFVLAAVGAFLVMGTARADEPGTPGGELKILDAEGQPVGACPLKYTDVEADIVGFVGRVTVKQVFHNPLDRKIEAIYVFPLPQDAAVDDMVMTVGDRRVVGQIKPREEAREIYDAAKAAGHVASLLDQERPNIFTQSVANIEPGVQVVIEISYVETLKYEDGMFEWVFPMVVGPRYIPGQPTSKVPPVTPEHQGKVSELDKDRIREGVEEPKGTGWSPDTDQVPDASKITPPVVKPGYRAGHDISLAVHLDAGTELFDLASVLHEIDVQTDGPSRAAVTLKNETEIPNKDFVLRYRLATDQIEDGFLVHSDERGTFFTLILQPPRRVVPEQVLPRELIFVLDTSGSMSGFPIEKAKEVMSMAIDAMRPDDVFNLITFAGDTRILWNKPRANTWSNRDEAQAFLASRQGRGGTEMMKAINAALAPVEGSDRMRIVCFMTDGYVGNDFAINDAVKKYAGTTRVFSFGIGNSVNRFLLDGMAHAGRGEAEYVTLQSQGGAAAERFHERILAPVLADIQVDWGDLPVADVYPKHFPDLFCAKPLMIHGRLTGPAQGTITLKGNTGGGPFERRIEAITSKAPADHNALASLWARAKVKDLMLKDYGAMQRGDFPEELKSQVTALGVEFRLMTQFTSFVAVEEMTVTVGGEPTTITVPVEMPDGVSYKGVFGGEGTGFYAPSASSYGVSAPGSARQQRLVIVERLSPAAKKRARPAAGGAPRPTLERRALDVEEMLGPRTPEDKLAEPLRGLAEKVTLQGKDGNLKVDGLRVVDYRVDVMIYLSDVTPETIEALKELGFIQTGESKAIKLLIGTIDVRNLQKLVELKVVIRVKPVGQ
jgi:Ca-activated chloride channel family protein